MFRGTYNLILLGMIFIINMKFQVTSYENVSRLEKRKVKKLLERFQNMDKEYLAELYPRVDVKKLVDEVSGHWQR